SKQTKAPPLDVRDPAAALIAAARFLGMAPPSCRLASAEFWAWARENWRLDEVPRAMRLPLPDYSR
ncbi:MAG: tRNA glutamyl-Q(34) synthetase GluQRS, partial [Rhodocyclaceae bacterium]